MKKIIVSLLALVALASCTQNQIDEQYTAENELRLTADATQTRVSANGSWETTDRIGIYMYHAGTQNSVGKSNSRYKPEVAGSVVNLLPVNNEDKLFFPNEPGMVDIFALLDPSSEDEVDLRQYHITSSTFDQLFAQAKGIDKSKSTTQLIFRRMVSKISYELTSSDGSIDLAKLVSVSVPQVKGDAVCNLLEGSYDYSKSVQGDLTSNAVEDEFILVPQTIAPRFEIDLGNEYGRYVAQCEEVTMGANAHYTYTVDVTLTGVTISGSIMPWESLDEQHVEGNMNSGYYLTDFKDADFMPAGDAWAIWDDNADNELTFEDFEDLNTRVTAAAEEGRKISLIFPKLLSLPINAFSYSKLVSISLLVATDISENAFYKCTSLRNVSLPAAESVSSDAFSHCNALTSLNIGYDESGEGNHAGITYLNSNWLNFLSESDLSKIELHLGYTLSDIKVISGEGGSASFNDGLSSQTFKSVTQAQFMLNLETINSDTNTSKSDTWVINTQSNADGMTYTSATFAPLREILLKAASDSRKITLIFPDLEVLPSNILLGSEAIVSASLPAAIEIRHQAFENCSQLRDISLPAATKVQDYVFRGCSSLTSLTIGYDHNSDEHTIIEQLEPTFLDEVTKTEIDLYIGFSSRGVALANIDGVTVAYQNGDIHTLKSVTQPPITIHTSQAVKSDLSGSNTWIISSNVDEWYESIREILRIGLVEASDESRGISIILQEIVNIPREAFLNQPAIEKVSLPATINIGISAFKNCTSLREVLMPAATTIHSMVFENCTSLLEVSLPKATTINDAAFSGCTSLREVLLPAVTILGSNVFKSCTSLREVSLPKATSIDIYAFRNCTSLREVSLPAATVTPFGAFSNCSSLREVSLPKATSIKDNAFENCASLTMLNIGYDDSGAGKHAAIESIEYNFLHGLKEADIKEITLKIGHHSYTTEGTEITIDSYTFDFAKIVQP